MDFSRYYEGNEFCVYEYLGAHKCGSGFVFRTYAPNAEKVSLIGDFSQWQELPMKKVYDGNFWEYTADNARSDMLYKYRIYQENGQVIDHADPYACCAELRPKTASILYDSQYEFRDGEWMNSRKNMKNGPVNIYEMHMGSWRKPSEKADDWYTYGEAANQVIPYLKENGYNFVEIMPLSEYPCDESWGYQQTGFFSPTMRYGKPDGLRYFIDQCHQNHIGVLLDFVAVHFAVNDYALWNYDGTSVYEYPYQDVSYNEWGSCNFNHGKGEVRSFLQSSAYYWLKEFHFDGLRMDAVGNLIYWQGKEYRGENKKAIAFLQNMNCGLKERMPEILLCAEDSTAYPNVTKTVKDGGLGFDFKWDMGWMHDTLSYLSAPESWRSSMYHKLTFSMYYFYNERYLLPLSHDEVVHGKKSVIDKMNGNYEEKFAQARALYLYMMTRPGKKLNFMGNEIGQIREWDEKKEQDWFLLKYPMHDAFHHYIRDLNYIYLEHASLWESDYEPEGFEWVDCHQEQKCLYVYKRKSKGEMILVILNFSGKEQTYRYELQGKENLTLLLNSEWDCYNGNVKKQEDSFTLSGDEKESISLKLPPYSGKCYCCG